MIKTQNLSKHYGDLKAVDDLSFAVEPGQVLGFLGPNGAGKSTTMKMIAGFVAPSAGSVEVCGHDVMADPIAAKQCIGYLPEGAPNYAEMTPWSFLNFIAEIRGLDSSAKRQALDRVIGELHLEGVLDQTIDTLSKGFKRRVGLAQAIIHDPQALILDEPTDGLDPNQKHEVRSLINRMAANKIIIISTHILEEVDSVCDRAIIIANGRICADDTPKALESRSRYHNAVTIKLGEQGGMETVARSIEALDEVARIEHGEGDDRLTAFPKDERLVLPGISDLAQRNNWSLAELHLESGRLDEVFRSITSETLT